MSAIRDLITFASRNGGVFTVQDAEALGVTEKMIRTRVDSGVFVRIGRGVLSLPGTATRSDVLLRAAGRVLGAIVSHQSAARIHGVGPVTVKTPSVTVSHRSTHSFHGITVHQSTDLLDAHVTEHEGMKVTTPERTIIDLAQVTGEKRLEHIVDNALAGRIVRIEDIAELHRSLSRKGKPGVRRLRGILSKRLNDGQVPLTVLERETIQLLVGTGLPRPAKQFKAPWLKPVDGRVDFAYVDQRLIIEVDSRRWHALFDAFETDRRRDNAVQLAGWRILRFTWAMVTEEPDEVVAAVRQALATRPNPHS
ncbi:MAG: type IV toxin-antitoxin system AbiEi family antitoxin domain-containing protein [Acidimicrobiia bacterium]|nr:type IV toxin-antitoxin system AbiEi family antitoxin domain-containing protein [Acidimicrobiia bacterium]